LQVGRFLALQHRWRADEDMLHATTAGDIALVTEEAPPPGETREIAPELFWARLPLPMRLNHVNIWLMREGDGWLAIDAGLDTAACRDIWEKLLAGPLGGRPIRRLVLTHGHPDHVGLAGWLSERFDCRFQATRTEWLFALWRREQRGQPMGARIRRFFLRHGCDAETLDRFEREDATIERGLYPVPAQFERLRHGRMLTMGGRPFRVIVGGGHADEHASFQCENRPLLIAGDQILQRITPMIGVFGNEPEGDPLSDYLASLERFEPLPADTLVLPSHGLPFIGLHARLRQLRAHHEERLAQFLDAMDRPRSAYELAGIVFERAMQEGQGRFALAETLAHLRYGETQGQARRITAADGGITFVRA
jgi:glyoxylase-like metal-dependent hydrolase (beta-lactamase superfamily II)